MHHFRFIHDELYCEDIAVNKIAENIETPFYLYSQKTIVDNFLHIQTAFQKVDHLVCYALKANSNRALLSLLAKRGAGADVVSGGEIYLALQSGFPPEKIVYAGVGKRDDEIRYALEHGILAFNVESYAELQIINEIARSQQQIAPVAIRLNPNIDIAGHPYISTGKAVDKFGIDLQTAKNILKKFDDFANIKLLGLHCHIGSQITKSEPFLQMVQFLKEVAEEVRVYGHELHFVDMGGGVSVPYKNVFQKQRISDENELQPVIPIENFLHKLLPDLKDFGCKIIFEPGRALIAEAGILVTRVLFRKASQGKQFVIVDAGMNDLIRPSLYGAYHEIVPLQKTTNAMQKVEVVGPICETGDFLAQERWLPEVKRGELLAVMTTGAYGYSLASNYNARLKPAEVLVQGSKYQIIRERGKMEDL